MGKETGLGANYYVDGNDLSGDAREFGNINKGLSLEPFTGIDKSAMERTPAILDGGMDWISFYNPTNAHPVLSTLPRADRIASYVHKAAVLGTPVCSVIGKQMNYDGTRDDKGMFVLKTQVLSNAQWVDWGLSLTTGKATHGGATNGTGVDFAIQGAPASFGLQAYLHVFAFTGTSATIKLQGSSDNAVGDPYADITGGAFTTVSTFPQSQRIQTARNLAVERWMRVVTTGTFSNLVFAVSAAVNIRDLTI